MGTSGCGLTSQSDLAFGATNLIIFRCPVEFSSTSKLEMDKTGQG
jgi:hypothetical protein